ncbi:MAG: nucleoside-triphosphatase [Candidatus Poseidoniia archaeon]|jgi:nucleoside-triphosphatase|uniref:Nucleotide kinase n=1 Tax=Marine Group III euryarchaeote TaxID=2173149 RepID=A0A7C7ZCS3_9ARCH|nr:nucleoside-triphosphatase [Candidatus Poseidoniia archaeon]MEE1544799.1 nucleoside-triphosphatase [Alphaproteobacteria bacterium]RZD32559.1 MAG: nucleotide kinase [Euryarchaeota archaeon]HIG63039.1 nucleotide kinase [Marine Group III euryarchaeote]HIL32701.1 nucleotide kinase [Candidatus Poseidoniales archaeon]|tara:strand:- start:730 stop:1290 length:561 start_codon:yes stop_codon:yes gene_type:complete
MIPVKLAISGQPGTGKTGMVLKIAEMVSDRFSIGGFTTHAIDEDGVMVGIMLRDYITGEEELAASVRWDVKPRVPGRTPEATPLGIRLDTVKRIAVKSVLRAIEENDLILIDEVGKLVSESKEFAEALDDALECGKPMLITMHKRSRNPLLQSIRKRDDLRTLEVTRINSGLLPSKAVRILKTGMV